MPKAYPVYDDTYADNVEVLRPWLEENTPNVHPVGRNGMHKYNNQDHSMYTAMLTVENILGADHDIWAVNVEEEYHETGRGGPAPAVPDETHRYSRRPRRRPGPQGRPAGRAVADAPPGDQGRAPLPRSRRDIFDSPRARTPKLIGTSLSACCGPARAVGHLDLEPVAVGPDGVEVEGCQLRRCRPKAAVASETPSPSMNDA